MAKYSYDKFKSNHERTGHTIKWVFVDSEDVSYFNCYTDYALDITTGGVTTSGSRVGTVSRYSEPGAYYTMWLGVVIRLVLPQEYNWKVDRYEYELIPTYGYVRGEWITSVIAENGTYPANGRHSDGYWYVRGSIVPDPTYPPSPPSSISVPSTVKGGEPLSVTWGAGTGATSYYLERSINGGAFSNIYSGSSRSYTENIAKGLNTIAYRVRSYNSDGFSGYTTSPTRTVINNTSPTIALATTDNRTLYENDVLNLSGNAKDVDSGNVVTVRYSIDNGTIRAITTSISTGVDIPYNKSITFKQNKLYDGATEITGDLAEGTQHILKVWAEDDKGGKSTEQIRNFYVVGNRPATLTINPFSPATDLINTDRVTVSGSVSDPDNNTVKVLYKIANGSFIEIYDGAGGEFSFQILLSNLIIGVNTITIQAKDSYGAITNKTLQITKTENLQPLKTAVARYKLTAPNGTAKGVVLWIEREVGDLVVAAEISMGMNNEVENFITMTKTATAFVREGIEEDEFTFDAGTAKENIILKLTMTRTSTVSNKGITLISGVLS